MKFIYYIKKFKKSKRKGRIYKIIQSRTQTQDKIPKDIIQLFYSNFSYFKLLTIIKIDKFNHKN